MADKPERSAERAKPSLRDAAGFRGERQPRPAPQRGSKPVAPGINPGPSTQTRHPTAPVPPHNSVHE
jgi:hypothetical protein